MSSAKDRLTAKTRRRMSFPVEISDPTEARRAVDEARQKVLLNAVSKTGQASAELEAALTAAEKNLATHYEDVAFEAAPPRKYEELSAVHFDDKDEKDVSIDDVLPALAALCAVDEDLRQEPVWQALLDPDTTTWSIGERGDLYMRLVDLNVARPDARIPKG